MTDGNRHRLILLAEARGHANGALLTIAKLVESLERAGHEISGPDLSAIVRTTKGVWTTLLDIHDGVSAEIGKVP